jgi:8-oxo-dGTP pyrophosphatase MutT (NUDIX family)
MVDPGLSDAEAAAMEAREEAGIEGELSPAPLGTFTYEKLGRSLLVQVFSMRVTKIHDTWLEQSFRRREWFPVDEATDLVSREGVRRLIRKFAEEMGRTGEGRRVGGVE